MDLDGIGHHENEDTTGHRCRQIEGLPEKAQVSGIGVLVPRIDTELRLDVVGLGRDEGFLVGREALDREARWGRAVSRLRGSPQSAQEQPLK